MGEFNPYESPLGDIPGGLDRARPSLTAARAFSIVIASGLSFSAAGAGIGYALGVVAPAYYRGVFSNGNDPSFDPAQVGLGLGLSQGMICGVVVGIAVILAVAISRRRA